MDGFPMSLLIYQDDKQPGPFTLGEARSLVLSGQLGADDWAWPDGATDWTHLKDVPGFSSAKPAPPAVVSSVPASPVAAVAPEQELWRGHPSQVLNFSIYLFWGMILIVTLGIVVVMVQNESTFWSLIIFGAVAVIALINTAVAYLHLRAVE